MIKYHLIQIQAEDKEAATVVCKAADQRQELTTQSNNEIISPEPADV